MTGMSIGLITTGIILIGIIPVSLYYEKVDS